MRGDDEALLCVDVGKEDNDKDEATVKVCDTAEEELDG